MLKEMKLREVIESGKLENVTTIKEVKEVLNISDSEFKTMWKYAYSSKDSAPAGTTDIDLDLEYETDDQEFPEAEGKVLINVSDNAMKDDVDIEEWKVNSVQIIF